MADTKWFSSRRGPPQPAVHEALGRRCPQGGPSQGNIATHEGHAAAIMWQRQFNRAVLIVDRAMCKICGQNLPSTLPPRARLVVISEEEGTTLLGSTHAT